MLESNPLPTPAGPRAPGPFEATDLLQLMVHVQIAVPLNAQEIQLFPQGRILHQLDVKATGDLGGGVQSLSEAPPASLFHTRPRLGACHVRGPIPYLGTLRALPSSPKDPGISLLSLGTLHPSGCPLILLREPSISGLPPSRHLVHHFWNLTPCSVFPSQPPELRSGESQEAGPHPVQLVF